MIDRHATPEDFEKWEAHAATCSYLSLQYIIKDCLEAAEAMRHGNPIREGYYMDQASTYAGELQKRKKAMPSPAP